MNSKAGCEGADSGSAGGGRENRRASTIGEERVTGGLRCYSAGLGADFVSTKRRGEGRERENKAGAREESD